MTSHAVMSLPLDERPAALQHAGADRPARPDITLGAELLIDDIDEHMAAANQAGDALRRARAAHDMLAINAAALEMRRHLKAADARAQAIQSGALRHLRREPRIRS